MQEDIKKIHNSEYECVIACSGGGTCVLPLLLNGGGGSKTLLEAIVPYSKESFDDFMGCKVNQYCSESAAIKLAMRSFEKAKKYSKKTISKIIGVGCTCALKKTNEERENRVYKIYVATQTFSENRVLSLEVRKDNPEFLKRRLEQENIAGKMIIYALSAACGIPFSIDSSISRFINRRSVVAPTTLTNIIHYNTDPMPFDPKKGWKTIPYYDPHVIFPGSFNPLHNGHLEMAELAYEYLDRGSSSEGGIDFEISVSNINQPNIDYFDLMNRVSIFGRASNMPHVGNMWITNAPTFVDKARLFPNAYFIVGIDTIEKISNVKNYRFDAQIRDFTYNIFKKKNIRFLVFSRMIEDKIKTLNDIRVPKKLKELCIEIDNDRRFFSQMSSSELREAKC